MKQYKIACTLSKHIKPCLYLESCKEFIIATFQKPNRQLSVTAAAHTFCCLQLSSIAGPDKCMFPDIPPLALCRDDDASYPGDWQPFGTLTHSVSGSGVRAWCRMGRMDEQRRTRGQIISRPQTLCAHTPGLSVCLPVCACSALCQT